MEALHAFRKGLNTVLNSACALIFAAMVAIGTYQIVTRFIFRSPSTVSEELLTYSFTWMALLATAYVFGKMDHMRMGFMADKFSEAGRKILSITQSTASLGIPMGVVYTIIPISGILIVIYSVLNIIDLATGYAKAPGGETEA